ncbi:MAG: hypothetical protein BAJALOKI1v1_1460007 [Promethearchaeota archaeon]|nr:MAG: hypothetical protein BAJALOKI1v1_1460007 [Candidatus Lokiarchaeota archaeon]
MNEDIIHQNTKEILVQYELRGIRFIDLCKNHHSPKDACVLLLLVVN